MISDSELSELISVPKEWRSGEEKIVWPRTHDKFNVDWLENLWKYLAEYCKTDLTMMENFNIIYSLQSLSGTPRTSSKSSNIKQIKDDSIKSLVLYKLHKNSNLVYTPPYHEEVSNTEPAEPTTTTDESTSTTQQDTNPIVEETYSLLIKLLSKLGFQCIDTISPTILGHVLFQNYVPNLRRSRFNLLRAFRNKYKHASLVKITQDFNALLNESDIKLLQAYLSQTEQASKPTSSPTFSSTLNSAGKQQAAASSAGNDDEQSLIDLLKELPIFENSAVECSEKYLPLKEVTLIYEAPTRLPFELPGIKPFIIIQNSDTRQLVQDKLNIRLVKDFSIIIKEIIRYCTSKELNTLSPAKVHALGKWMLLNCSPYFLAYDSAKKIQPNISANGTGNTELIETIRSAKLFLNQNQELCSASQFINPLYKERYLPILETKWLPARDLISEEKCISVLRELKMRTCFQFKVDEITELYEYSLRQTDAYRRLFAELIVETLVNRLKESNAGSSIGSGADSIEKILNEYSTTKAVTLRHFLMSVEWIPLQRERPQSYPQSLQWKGGDASQTSAAQLNLNNLLSTAQQQSSNSDRVRFSSPRDCVDSQFAYCTGLLNLIDNL